MLFKLFKNYLNKFEYRASKKYKPTLDYDINELKEIWNLSFNRNEVYTYFHHHFWNRIFIELKEHRKYFRINNRGFGEDAFHSMWYFIFNIYKPKKILEIGVYRGQTLTLFSLLTKILQISKAEIHGISPFTNDGDEVSNYLKLDYYEDVNLNIDNFKLTNISLHKGYSTDSDIISKVIESHCWDLIYIDGNHDYEVVLEDFNNCAQNLKKGGIVVLDDASLFTNYNSNSYSSKGHYGPSKVAEEISSNQQFVEILGVGHNRVFQKQ